MAQRPMGGRLATLSDAAFITPAKRSPSPEQQEASGEASRRQLFRSKAATGPAKANSEDDEVQSKMRQCFEGKASSRVDAECPGKGTQQRCRKLFGVPSRAGMEHYFEMLEEQANSAFRERWGPTKQSGKSPEWIWSVENRPSLAQSSAEGKHPRSVQSPSLLKATWHGTLP